jgi:hypothetical protein
MLLREFDQSEDFLSDLENVLNLYLKDSDKKRSPAKINYETINNWLTRANVYGRVNKSIIDAAIEKSDTLRNLIARTEDNYLVLNTDIDKPKDDTVAQPDLEKTDQGISKTTQQAASRAAQSSID